MNRTRLLLIGVVALALGALVASVVYRNLKSNTASAAPPGAEIVIAAGDIPVGAKIVDNDVRIVRFPASDLPPGYFHQKSQVVGRGVVLPIGKGEFILPSKLAEANAGSGLTSLIPPGMRAVSVKVNEVVANSGYVQPGTRVDVLLTGNPSNGGEQQTTTVLENVAVIAAGQKLERSATGDPQTSAVITLLVSPDDAQKLTLASTQGKIQLSLRNPLDTKQEDLASVKTGALYKNSLTPIAPPKPRPKRTVAEIPQAPAVYSVEVIKGAKKDITKF